MRLTTIRSTLVTLIGSLGAVVMLLLALQLNNLNGQRHLNEDQFDLNVWRNQIVQAALAVAHERNARYLALSLDRPLQNDLIFQSDRSLLAINVSAKSEEQASIFMAAFIERLSALRREADEATRFPPGSIGRQNAAVNWFDGTSLVVADLLSLRIKLLSQMDSASPKLFGLYYLRTQTLTLLDELIKNAAVLEVDIALGAGQDSVGSPASPPLIGSNPLVTQDITQTARQFNLVFSATNPEDDKDTFNFELYSASYLRLRTALESGEGIEREAANWRRVSADAIRDLTELQEATSKLTQDATRAIQTETKSLLGLWAFVLLASCGVVGVAVAVVLRRVVGPLERMRHAMLQLADDNFAVELPLKGNLAEIDAMDDALRVFKANGIRRQNLQKERLRLHGRLEETYNNLKTDLEAAAVIQASLLPQHAQLGGVSLSSYFRPSHYLAGDTFDVLQQPDGRVIVFQIDVAGHGAAAALVSVASKYTVAQAILQRQPGIDLATLTEQINREWPGDLPFFTLLLAEIDPATGQGTMVQAGHPSPMLLRASGELYVLGDGGLPVGVLPHATFDLIHFAIEPHDRLIVMTDGVHEMADPEGELFSEERVQELMRASGERSTDQILADLDTALRTWRGNETLDDDVTIVILEGKRKNEHL